MNIQEFRRSQFEQQRREEEAKAREIERAIEEMELALLQLWLEAHYSLMMNFIRTKAALQRLQPLTQVPLSLHVWSYHHHHIQRQV